MAGPIASLYVALGLDDKQYQAGMKNVGAAADGVGGKFAGLSKTLTSNPISNGLLQGVGLAGGLVAFNAIGTAIASVTSFMGDAVKAAQEDQLNVDHLTTSLRANVPAWTGTTTAIDAFITKGQQLAFTDDDIRDSIAKLVTRTHDVTKAINLTRQAMDLARLKGLSLATASDLIGKVYGGNIGILSRYGIAVDKGSTAVEALAQIQKAAAGQADTYANSEVGRAQAMQDKWRETQETIGKGLVVLQGIGTKVLGVVVNAVEGLISAIGELGTHFDNLHRIIDGNYKASEDAAGALKDLADQYGFNYDAVQQFTNAQKLLAQRQAEAAAATHRSTNELILADVAALNHEATLQDLADIATKYGLSSEDVANIIQNQTDAEKEAAQALAEKNAATDTARAQLIAYAKAMGIANIFTYASAAATSQDAAAADEATAAQKRRRQEMEHGILLLEDSTTAQRIFDNVLGTSSMTLTDKVVPNYRNASRAIYTAMQTARDKAVTYLGQIPVFASDEFRSGLHLIKSAMAAYKLAITEPVSKAKVIAAIDAKLTSEKLRANLKSHNPQIRQDTQELVDWLIAKRNELNGTVVFTGRVIQGSPNYIGPGGQGQTGGSTPSNAAPSTFRVNDLMTPNVPGNGPSTVRHELGTLTVRVDGSISPDAGREVGRGIGDRLSGVLVELGRMRTLPIGSGS